MRAHWRRAVLVVFFVLTGAARADAGFMALLDYLDNLSGPGPFRGPGVEVPLFCPSVDGVTWRCFWLASDDDLFRPRFRAFEIGPHVSWMDGAINDDMAYPVGTSDDEKEVDVFTYGVFGTGNLNNRFGITGKLTAYRFYGPLVRNGSQTQLSLGAGPVFHFPLQTMRIDVIPLAVVGLRGFSANDFGAIGGRLTGDSVKLAIHVGFYF